MKENFFLMIDYVQAAVMGISECVYDLCVWNAVQQSEPFEQEE